MRNVLSVLILSLMLAACSDGKLSSLPVEENQALVTHIKEPTLAVVDLVENKVLHSINFDFTIHSLVRVGSDQVALAGKLENEVLMLELSTGAVRPLLSEVTAITDLFYDEERVNLIMTDAKNNEALIYDLEKESEIIRIEVGSYPNSITVLNDYAYIVNGDDATVSVIDLVKKQVVHTFPILERPTTIYSYKDYLLVGGHGAYGELNEYVYVYESISGKLIERIKVGLMPIAFYADSHGQDVYVLCHGTNEMYVLDGSTFNVVNKMTTGQNPYFITGNEDRIFVTALDGNNLFVVDRNSYQITQEVSLYSGPFGIVLGGMN